jgi:uncharacterized membrane protein
VYANSSTAATADNQALPLGSAVLTGVLLGLGIAGFVDETAFHQLLQWHNFYWGTTQFWRIFSDGVFHLVTTLLLLWGVVRLWRDPVTMVPSRSRAMLGGLLIAAGGFNVYDGVIQHLIFHFHLVDEYVCATPQANNSIASCPQDIPYEVVWIIMGLIVVAIGVVLLRHARRHHAMDAHATKAI